MILNFNFCFSPLSKESILKLSVDIEDFLLIKDAVNKALFNFNKQNLEFKLKEDTLAYKVKLSKKSGLPDLDLPSIIN